MSPEWTLERALARYADRVYRIALLRDPHPTRAAQAVATAFQTLNWSTIELDDQLEGRLIAALPRLPRRVGRAVLAPLPADFRRLPAITRVALALRLTRAYSSDAIAGILGQSPDAVRQAVLDALSAPCERTIPEACHHSRLLRLDDAGAERGHTLRCESCRTWATRAAEAETTLRGAIEEATAKLRLPRATVEAIEKSRMRGAAPTPNLWRRPVTLSAGVAVVVVMVIAALIVPRSTAQRQAQTPATAQDFLATAMTQYGTVPSGEGVVHERFEITLRQPLLTLQAETWTDAANPGRHRSNCAPARRRSGLSRRAGPRRR